MTSAEFTEWIAYSRVEPFGYEMENWRFGMLAAEIVNAVHRSIPRPRGKSKPKEFKPTDFYPVVETKRSAGLSASQLEYIRRKKQRGGGNRRTHSQVRGGDGKVSRGSQKR